jgi:hypothetical protein
VRACRAVEGGERCTDPGVYRTWLEDCTACRVELGVLSCAGHSFCVQHAAEVRTGAYEFDDDDAFVVVTRMTGIAA